MGLGNLPSDDEFKREWQKYNNDEDNDYDPPPSTIDEGVIVEVVQVPIEKGKEIRIIVLGSMHDTTFHSIQKPIRRPMFQTSRKWPSLAPKQ